MKQILFLIAFLFVSFSAFTQKTKIVPANLAFASCESEFTSVEVVRWNVTKTCNSYAGSTVARFIYTISGLNKNGIEIYRKVVEGSSLVCYDGEEIQFSFEGCKIELTERIKTNL